MALNNSYTRTAGPVVTLLPDRQKSIGRVVGPTVTLLVKRYESYQRLLAFSAVDSTNTILPRIYTYAQRLTNSKGDLAGDIFNSNGGAITLTSVEYSQVSAAGPWLPLTVLTTDPAYNLPAIGAVGGTPFNIPVEITDNFTGNVWFKMVINSTLGATDDINGSFAFSPLPAASATISVPLNVIGDDITVSWGLSFRATYYRLQEATKSDFSDAVYVYTGPELTYTSEDRPAGTYYYRVLAGNTYGESVWTSGSNSCVIAGVPTPTVLVIPVKSDTGEFIVKWLAVPGANFYELQEAKSPDFADAVTVYNGSDVSYKVIKGKDGMFFYRLRAGVK